MRQAGSPKLLQYNNMKIRKNHILWAWFILLLLTPIVLWLLPADFFDNGQSICISKVFFNVECLGCGMTRAVMHLHHLELEDAIFYNQGSAVIYPALIVIWVMWVVKAARELGILRHPKQEQPAP